MNDEHKIIPFEKVSRDLKEVLKTADCPNDDDAVKLLLNKAVKMTPYRRLQYYLDWYWYWYKKAPLKKWEGLLFLWHSNNNIFLLHLI